MATIYRKGALRGDKIAFPDGVGYCVWYPLDDKPEDEDMGMCFDFPAGDIDDMIALLQELKDATADEYVEGGEDG